MLPELAGKRGVDLGCGFGWFCRWAREEGAARVLGLDVSANMLARARETTPTPPITYRAGRSRDARAAGRVVRPRLQLPHPALPRESRPACSPRCIARWRRAARLLGRASDLHRRRAPAGRRRPPQTWPVADYLDEGPRVTDWLAKGVVKQHRTLATYAQPADRCRLHHPAASRNGARPAREIAAHPEWKIDHRRPSFLLVSAARSSWARAYWSGAPRGARLTPPDAARPFRTKRRARPSRGRRARRDRDR